MVLYKEQKVQRPLHYAVIDEVDSILIDEARTPLIISGSAQKSTQLYIQANAFVRVLKKEDDYTYDEKTKGVQLTEEGMSKAEQDFSIENLFDISHVAIKPSYYPSIESSCRVCIVILTMWCKMEKLSLLTNLPVV